MRGAGGNSPHLLYCFMQCLSETLDELVFTDNGDAQLLGFLVLARLRGYIVVDEVVGRAAYAARNLAALTLDIGLELVAVFVVVKPEPGLSWWPVMPVMRLSSTQGIMRPLL